MIQLTQAEFTDLKRDAERFRHLQTIGPITAQAYFWNFSSPLKRAAAIDADIEKRRTQNAAPL